MDRGNFLFPQIEFMLSFITSRPSSFRSCFHQTLLLKQTAKEATVTRYQYAVTLELFFSIKFYFEISPHLAATAAVTNAQEPKLDAAALLWC